MTALVSSSLRKFIVAACVALAGCDGAPPPMTDAGALPPPCLRVEGGVAYNLEECGLCVHPHERALAALRGNYVNAVAVPEGLIVYISTGVGHLFFVHLDGTVSHQQLEPFTPEQPLVREGFPLWVPGTSRVWMVTNRFVRLGEQDMYRGDEADAALMEYDAEGRFSLVARGMAPLILPAVAMGGGELVGRMVDGLELNERWAVFRPLPDGTLERAEHPDPEIRSLRLDFKAPGWPMPGGGAALILNGWRYHYGPDFEELSPRVGAAMPILELRSRPDGSAIFVTDYINGQLVVQEMAADGTRRWEWPGRTLNPEGISSKFGPDSINLWETPGGRVLAVWSVYPDGIWISGLDSGGNLLWPEPRFLSGFGLPTPPRQNYGAEAVDGEGNAYAYHVDLLDPQPGPPADDHYDRIGIDLLDENGDYVWPDQLIVQTCDVADGRLESNANIWTVVGAAGEGLWVIYEDYLVGVDGEQATVQKIALVLPDGTFAW